MTVSSHVLTLRKKHQELSEEIEEAQAAKRLPKPRIIGEQADIILYANKI